MRKVNGSIYLKKPTLEELAYTEELLACEKTMAFNQKWGGTVPFPRSKWESFYNAYLSLETKNVYYHIYNLDNVFVGEISARYDEVYHLNIKVKHEYRGNNHAFDALDIFMEYLFDELEAKEVVDDIASDNTGAKKLLEKVGFRVIKETEDITYMSAKKSLYS